MQILGPTGTSKSYWKSLNNAIFGPREKLHYSNAVMFDLKPRYSSTINVLFQEFVLFGKLHIYKVPMYA